MVSTEALGRAICPDGKPADLIVQRDGTTWIRLAAHGVAAWANLDKLREPLPVPPVRAWRFEPSNDYLLRRGEWLTSAYVTDPRPMFGGVV
ncbi:hypothetical protein SEA_TAYLORSIPHT_62 [Arthrobacter phage TaylorSipht]|nr:hypothetical protein SEA_TAYLORSIPHT_62 [Arthrobacter phage TaylorSipht]